MTSFNMVVLAVVTVMAWDYWTSGGQLDIFRNLWPWDIPMIPYLSTPCKEGGTHMYAGNDWLRATKFGTITGQGEGKFVGELKATCTDRIRYLLSKLCCVALSAGILMVVSWLQLCVHDLESRLTLLPTLSLVQGAPWSWKVIEFRKTIFQARKVMENSKGHGKSWKMMIMSWNFYYCTEQFCKSDTTAFYKVKLWTVLSF